MEIRKVAEQAAFPSREALNPATAADLSERRLYRTGRNIQFSCKVTQEPRTKIYALTDELGRRCSTESGARRCAD
jgi:hypothetical protein